MFMLPARFVQGWAVGRARRRPGWGRFWPLRLGLMGLCGSLAATGAAVYVVLVFFSQYTGWTGADNLFNQHAFLMPIPFWNWAR